MDDSSRKNHIEPNTGYLIRETTKVCDFITSYKTLESNVLTKIRAINIITKIKAIPIPITDIDDKIA